MLIILDVVYIDNVHSVMRQWHSSGRYLAASTGSWFRWDRLLLQLNVDQDSTTS